MNFWELYECFPTYNCLLKLGDLSLLNSCVELVIKGFDLASEEDFKVQDQIVEQLWKYSKRLKATTISCQSLKE